MTVKYQMTESFARNRTAGATGIVHNNNRTGGDDHLLKPKSRHKTSVVRTGKEPIVLHGSFGVSLERKLHQLSMNCVWIQRAPESR